MSVLSPKQNEYLVVEKEIGLTELYEDTIEHGNVTAVQDFAEAREEMRNKNYDAVIVSRRTYDSDSEISDGLEFLEEIESNEELKTSDDMIKGVVSGHGERSGLGKANPEDFKYDLYVHKGCGGAVSKKLDEELKEVVLRQNCNLFELNASTQ